MSINITPKISISGWAGTVAIVIVAVVASFFTYQLSSRDKDTNDYRYIINEMKVNITDLQTRVKWQEKQLTVLRSGIYDEPVIRWIKDLAGRYIFFNKAFATHLLLPNGINPDEVLGQTDAEIFINNPENVKVYRKNDLEVIHTGKKKVQNESMIVDGKKVNFRSIKYPIYSRMSDSYNSDMIGVGGVAMEID